MTHPKKIVVENSRKTLKFVKKRGLTHIVTWPENRFAYAEISAAALGWDCVIETHLWKIHNVNDPIELYTLFVNKNCQQKQISCSMNQSALSKCDTVKKEFSKHRHDIVSSLPFSKTRKIGPGENTGLKKLWKSLFYFTT